MAKKKRPKLLSYHFDCGNSTDGPVGFCARITATSKKRALEILRETIPETIEVDPYDFDRKVKGERVEYYNVYISSDNVVLKDIDDAEPPLEEE